jgi:hypothetical protein
MLTIGQDAHGPTISYDRDEWKRRCKRWISRAPRFASQNARWRSLDAEASDDEAGATILKHHPVLRGLRKAGGHGGRLEESYHAKQDADHASLLYGGVLAAAPLGGVVVLTWWLGAYALVFGASPSW